MIVLLSSSCASSRYTARVLHSDTRKPISGVTLHLTEATGGTALNGWPTMERIDRGVQVTDDYGECTFMVKTPGYCSVFAVPFMDFDYTDRPSDYFEEETGILVLFMRPQNQ